jgi:hypothetical protein
MKKVLTVAALAVLISTPVFAEQAASVSLLPHGLGLELNNDFYYEIEAARAMSEPTVVVEFNNAYVEISPTINVSEFEMDSLETRVGYNFEFQNLRVSPYVRSDFTNKLGYDETSLGFTTSMRF